MTSKNSINSSFVSWLNGAPLVSLAHSSSASELKNAWGGGESRRLSPVEAERGSRRGVQYLANMCFRQASSYHPITDR